MIHSLIGSLPRHLYVWVQKSFLVERAKGFVPAVWFGIVSHPGRAWGCNVLLESGAVYRNLPPHALAFMDGIGEDCWPIHYAQLWNCYGYNFAVLEYPYLSGLNCWARFGSPDQIPGTYLFTAAPIGDGFSEQPEQSKEFSFIRLINGRLTIQPTNHVLFEEKSFTGTLPCLFPTNLRKQTEVWSVE